MTIVTAVGTHRTWTEANQRPVDRAADALPIYLAAATVLDGGDPTDKEDLGTAYSRRAMSAFATTFSNLYPASAGALIQPLAVLRWPTFVEVWRGLLLFGGLLGGAGAGLAAVRGRGAPLAAALGAWMAVSIFPVTAECISLGQANLLLAGLFGLAMAALSRGHDGTAATLAAVGAGIKLVPGVVLLSLVAGRRWRGTLAFGLAGLAIAGLTLSAVPLDRVLAGIQGSLQFQSTVSPDWLNQGENPAWMRTLGALRHTPLAQWTLVATAVLVGWGAHRGVPTQTLLAASVALACAWLGADAAGFHVLYAPLYIPAWAYICLWGLDARAPRGAWLSLGLIPLPAWLYTVTPGGVPPEFALVLGGMVIWLACLVRLVAEAPPMHLAKAWLPAGLLVGWGLASADLYDERPQGPAPEPGQSAEGIGLPTGVGHGGPIPVGAEAAERLAGPTQGRRSIEGLTPEQSRRLTSHLVQAPAKLRQIEGAAAQALASGAPKPPVHEAAYLHLTTFLVQESVLLDDPNLGRSAQSAQSEWARLWTVLGDPP